MTRDAVRPSSCMQLVRNKEVVDLILRASLKRQEGTVVIAEKSASGWWSG